MNATNTDGDRTNAPGGPETPDDLLFVEEVSTWTRIPVSTLKYYRQRGSGPHSAIVGGKIRYRRGDVQGWLDAQFAPESARTA